MSGDTHPSAIGGGASGLPALVLVLASAIILPVSVLLLGGAGVWLAIGALSWALGVGAKIPLSLVVGRLVPCRFARFRAAALGATSAASELTAALWLLLVCRDGGETWRDLAAFVVGGACAEPLVLVAVVLGARPDAHAAERWQATACRSVMVRLQFLVERTIALLGHLAARGLVASAVVGADGAVLAFSAAFVGFAVTDGLAVYGQEARWDWFDPATAARFYGAVLLVACAEGAVLATLLALYGSL